MLGPSTIVYGITSHMTNLDSQVGNSRYPEDVMSQKDTIFILNHRENVISYESPVLYFYVGTVECSVFLQICLNK
jgi:hypothetical protein